MTDFLSASGLPYATQKGTTLEPLGISSFEGDVRPYIGLYYVDSKRVWGDIRQV